MFKRSSAGREKIDIDVDAILAMGEVVHDAANDMISDGKKETYIVCPQCKGVALVRLDFCCGVEAICQGSNCTFYMHLNLGLNFHEHGINPMKPLKPYPLCDYAEIRVVPLVERILSDGTFDIRAYCITLFNDEEAYPITECNTLPDAIQLVGRFASAYTSMLEDGFSFQDGELVHPDGRRVRLNELPVQSRSAH
ncbi:MAG: hypothetical protein K6T83_00115 [Alicyclobacillus sp.]|nr:hypothetical protein [Alicyclobacillus sp.]